MTDSRNDVIIESRPPISVNLTLISSGWIISDAIVPVSGTDRENIQMAVNDKQITDKKKRGLRSCSSNSRCDRLSRASVLFARSCNF